MHIELNESETKILHEALESYLSDLREELTKTEKHEWRVALQKEKEVLDQIKRRLS